MSRRGGTRAAVALALFGVVAVVARVHARGETRRYDGALFSFDYPADMTAETGTDPSADIAVVVRRDDVSATVAASSKRVGEAELEELADKWHNARIRNRAAWGVKPSGGPPRDTVRVGERRWMRWRDRIGSVLGAQEQTMTCGAVAGHLACVIASAPVKKREQADALAAQLLTSLRIHR
jgi:hypothetical protein